MRKSFPITLHCEFERSGPDAEQVANALAHSTAAEALADALGCEIVLDLAAPAAAPEPVPVPAPFAADEFCHGGLKVAHRDHGIYIGSNKRGRLATMLLSAHIGQRESLAYARLFAAAPDLLAALENASKTIEGHLGPDHRNAIAARAAIAKARNADPEAEAVSGS